MAEPHAPDLIAARATVTLDARALDQLAPTTIDRLADLVAARLADRRATAEAPLLTVADAAQVAGVHPETVRRAIRAGALRAAGYAGKRPRLRREEIERWLQDAASAHEPTRVGIRGESESRPPELATGAGRRAVSDQGKRGEVVSLHRVEGPDGSVRWRVRWRDGGRGSAERSRTFDRKADAVAFDDERRRRRRLGDLGIVVGSRDTLDEYVTETWAPTHVVTLAPKTATIYAQMYDLHIAPHLGHFRLAELTPEVIARWQAERIAAGAGRASILKSLQLLGSILQRAMESERIARNPVRLVRKAPRPPRREVRPLPPATIEAIRAACWIRDATLVSVLAYAGLRPGEALDLQWQHIGERTLTVYAHKTGQRRNVRLLTPLADDLRAWAEAWGTPAKDAFVFPAATGERWSEEAYKSWASRASRGRKRPDGARGGTGERSGELRWQLVRRTPRRTRCGIRSARCCCTRAAR